MECLRLRVRDPDFYNHAISDPALLLNRCVVLIVIGKQGFKFRHAESTAGACLEHLADLFGAGEVAGLDSFDNGIDTHTEADTHDAETL